MLDEHAVRLAKEVLLAAIEKEESLCNGWSKSSDRGACMAYKVHPLKRAVEYLETNVEGVDDE